MAQRALRQALGLPQQWNGTEERPDGRGAWAVTVTDGRGATAA